MFWRLLGSYGILSVAAIFLLGLFLARRVEQYERRQIEQNLHTQLTAIKGEVGKVRPDRLREWVVKQGELQGGLRITLLDSSGKVLADSDVDNPESLENHAHRPEILAAGRERFGTDVRRSASVNESMMYVAARLPPGEGPVAYVRVALSLERIHSQLADLRWLAVTTAGIAAVATLLITAYLSRIIARPVEEVSQAAEEIAAGKYGQKVESTGRGEVARLARSFNLMSASLAAQINRLEEEQQQLRAILSGMVEGVVALDAQQRILFANERAAGLLDFALAGHTTHGAVGRRLWDVVRQRHLLDVVQRALAENQPQRAEINWTGPVPRSVTVHAACLQGQGAGPPRGAVLVIHDTSELRRLERLRHEFVANVSHELKTPLACIMAAVETLLEGGAGEDPVARRTFLEQVADQSERLHRLILDLLSLARIESGQEIYSFSSVPVAEVALDCVERHRARAEAKNQSLEALPAGEAVSAWADEEALQEILDNLVDNAVKYTPVGGTLRLRWWAEGDSAFLEVKDNGIGIPAQDLPRIFERFYRVDKARSRMLGGTGLGLSIVKHLVQAMHGTISAASQLGQGTTFTVRLPRTAPRREPVGEPGACVSPRG